MRGRVQWLRRCATASEARPRTVPFLEFAQTARQDVAELVDQLQGSYPERLRALSTVVLETWPAESPHWRVAGSVLLPEDRFKQLVQEVKDASAEDLDPSSAAAVLRALCAVHGRTVPLLLDVIVKEHVRLAAKLPLEELVQCVSALQTAPWAHELKDSPLKTFATQAVKRLTAGRESLTLQQLVLLLRASQKWGQTGGRRPVAAELQRRLLRVSAPKAVSPEAKDVEGTSGQDLETAAFVEAAHALGEVGALRASRLRQALLPDQLSLKDAVEVLRHAASHETFEPAHEFIVSLAARKITQSQRQMSPREIAAAVRGVAALQASGKPFAVTKAAALLKTLSPRIFGRVAYFAPSELSDILCAYWWQLLYSHQELAARGESHTHPLLPSLAREKEGKALEQLSTKLLRPVLQNLQELPLKQVTACLTALAPPVRPPDVISQEDRGLVREAVASAFAGASGEVEGVPVFVEGWMQDFWDAELRDLTAAELLELACGLREAGMDWRFPMTLIMAEINRRLRLSPGQQRQEVELSHFLLLRLCRIMDLWHTHEVENMLKSMLSNPEALRPLPTAYFVGVLTALSSFPVPKDLPLRLASSFLDREELGEVAVLPEQWADLLCAVRPLDEPFFERLTPRLLQQLLPHLSGLPDPVLLRLLEVLAAAPPKEKGEIVPASPLEQAPGAFSVAMAEVVKSGRWDLQKVLTAFDCLGKLGWYDERAVAEVLRCILATHFLEPHAPLLLPLLQACNRLHVHHAALLQKVVTWYCWCYAYLWNQPVESEKLEELLELAEQLMDLSFQSMELQGVLTENLSNPNATARQSLKLLSVLARFSHFPPEFKESCARVCSGQRESDLTSLSNEELVNAFNIHLCAVFDGPAALKHWFTEDDSMKLFFQVHTSQKWYQKQDFYRSMFRQSDAFMTLRDAAEKEGLDLRTSDAGEVYHLEFVSRDAKERLANLSEQPPLAVICITNKEQLRWYVPITEAGEELEKQNRCRQFHYMFKGAVQKVRHAQTMGYRPCIIWMSDWNELKTEEERRQYLKTATADYEAFRPFAEEEDLYR